MNNNIQSGIKERMSEWRTNRGVQSVDFIVTEDCNMRCKYCYICHKQSNHILDFSAAKKFIDYLFSGEIDLPPAIILGFIGGEPFLETELIDSICDYFKFKSYECNSPLYWNYRISATTNGVNYNSPAVQKFIAKNHNMLSLTMTVDGTKEKHDLQRVFPDGSGSYDIIAKNIPLYLKQCAPTTKVTFAHADLSMLYDSIVHLWNIGFEDISANVVFEDVWEPGDDKIYEYQLKKLADYMLKTEIYKKCNVSFFDEHIGAPLSEDGKKTTICGAGLMLGLGTTGKIYPCLRYKDYSLENHDEVVIGHVDTGIDFNKVLRYRIASNQYQYDAECLNCEIATGCAHCQAYNYDSADTPTNYQRNKAICPMHKARVRANNYFWNRLYNEKGISRKSIYNNEYKKMYFALNDNYMTYCEYNNYEADAMPMSINIQDNALAYCEHEFYTPVFVHSISNPDFADFTRFSDHKISHIISAKFYNQIKEFNDYILVFDKNTIDFNVDKQSNSILNIQSSDIHNLSCYALKLFNKAERINLNILDVDNKFDLEIYKSELIIIKDYIFQKWSVGELLEFNRLTDLLFTTKQESCTAGDNTMAVAPDGNYYTCPASYKVGGKSVGSVVAVDGITVKNKRLYTYNYAPLCINCPATHCIRCAVTNINGTKEVNVPPQYKCAPSIVEYKVSAIFRQDIADLPISNGLEHIRQIPDYEYSTPYEWHEAHMPSALLGFRMVAPLKKQAKNQH